VTPLSNVLHPSLREIIRKEHFFMPEVRVTKENGGALAHRPEVYFPTFPLTGMFSASPFKFMKRFTDEMDRALPASTLRPSSNFGLRHSK